MRCRRASTLNLQPRDSYLVQKGDTVSGIAARQGVSISALIQLNNLRPPYTLQIGQALVLPTSVDAPSTFASAPQAAALPAGPQPKPFVPTAPPLYDASRRRLCRRSRAAASRRRPATAARHASAALPSSEPAPGEPVEIVPSSQRHRPRPRRSNRRHRPSPRRPAIRCRRSSPTAPSSGRSTARSISKFGPAKDNLRNDGINIAAPVGAPVKASAAGVVAYAGNELRGFGNMVLLRHADGWVTAYAHNSSLLVKKGDKVDQGQTIARVGSSGNVDSPQLHFELRKGTKAVDPLKVLTK